VSKFKAQERITIVISSITMVTAVFLFFNFGYAYGQTLHSEEYNNVEKYCMQQGDIAINNLIKLGLLSSYFSNQTCRHVLDTLGISDYESEQRCKITQCRGIWAQP
jgi:hypothetical protein